MGWFGGCGCRKTEILGRHVEHFPRNLILKIPKLSVAETFYFIAASPVFGKLK